MSNSLHSVGAAALLLATVCLPAAAATEQWTYDGLTGVFQLVADGAGGCAMTRIGGSSMYSGEVVWLNNRGELIYQDGLSNTIYGGGIMVCTPAQLVYGDVRGSNIVIHVSQSGAVTLPAEPNTMNTSPLYLPIYQHVLADSKGFFAVRTDTNTLAVSVVRYSNK